MCIILQRLTHNIYRTTRGRLDEEYSDYEVSVAVHACMSFAPKIAVVVDNHSLLAIRTSDVEGNISAYLRDFEPSKDEGCVVVYRLVLQGVEVDVDVDNLSTRRCTESRWDSLDGMTGGGCLVALVSCNLHADNRVVVAVLWVVQHNVSHVDVGERMTTSKTGRAIIVYKWTLGSRGWVENEPMTIKCAEMLPTNHKVVCRKLTTNHKRVVVRVTWVCRKYVCRK